MIVQFDRAISLISVTLESADQINGLCFSPPSSVLRPPSLPLAARAPTLRPVPHPATCISCNERLNCSCDREEGDNGLEVTTGREQLAVRLEGPAGSPMEGELRSVHKWMLVWFRSRLFS
jgi:hypothetical protein